MIEKTNVKTSCAGVTPEDDLRCIRTAHVQHVGVRKHRVGTIRMGRRASHYADHVFGDLDESHVQGQAGA